MEAFKVHRGVVALLDRANVDTDAIIPKQFLKSILRTGFGENLFFDWRYKADGSPNPEFSLNRPEYAGASILVARNNFGCGSSREHAVWAIHQYGFRVVVAPWQDRRDGRIAGFADIFRNNCGMNGVLAVELSEAEVDEIFKIVQSEEGVEATVDLEKQQVTLHASEKKTYPFEVDPAVKHRVLNGLDDIGITLGHEAAITQFETSHDTQLKRAKNTA